MLNIGDVSRAINFYFMSPQPPSAPSDAVSSGSSAFDTLLDRRQPAHKTITPKPQAVVAPKPNTPKLSTSSKTINHATSSTPRSVGTVSATSASSLKPETISTVLSSKAENADCLFRSGSEKSLGPFEVEG